MNFIRVSLMRLFLIWAVLLVIPVSILAQGTDGSEQPERRPVRMKELGKQRGQALKEYEKIAEQFYEFCHIPYSQRILEENRPQRDLIIKAYRELIERYPLTEIEGMARQHILTLYATTDDMISAEASYKDLVKSMPCTEYEMDAHFFMGLHWLYRENSPKQASKYFDAIPDSRNHPYEMVGPGGIIPSNPGVLRPEEEKYIRARIKILRCYILQGLLEESAKEQARLIEDYPEAAKKIEKSLLKIQAEVFNVSLGGLGGGLGVDSDVTSHLSDIPEDPLNLPGKTVSPTADVTSIQESLLNSNEKTKMQDTDTSTSVSPLSSVPLEQATIKPTGLDPLWLLLLGGLCLLVAVRIIVIRKRKKMG